MRMEITTETREKTTVPTEITFKFGRRILAALSFIRRCRNPAERRAYLEAKWAKEDRATLLIRAQMNSYQWNTNVIRATPSTPPEGFPVGADFRIWVSNSMEDDWGDCVSIGFYDVSSTAWRFGSFSPARARLLAAKLVEMAEFKEQQQDCLNIDGPAK